MTQAEYADPDCPVCEGRGWIYAASMLVMPGEKGGHYCECVLRKQAARYWDREYRGVTRETLVEDEYSRSVLSILDALALPRRDDEPRGVLIVGRPGRGKTVPAVSTARRIATSRPYPTANVIRHADWLGDLRKASGRRRPDDEEDDRSADEMIEDAATPRVLVIDDVGADERATDFSRGVTVRLFDARIRMPGSLTIVTSNFPVGDPRWEEHMDERGLSRMLGLCSGRIVQVVGPDRRAMRRSS